MHPSVTTEEFLHKLPGKKDSVDYNYCHLVGRFSPL